MPRPPVQLSTREIGDIYRVHPRTVVRWISERGLPAVRAGGRWRVAQQDLEVFLVTGRFEPPADQDSTVSPASSPSTR